MPYAILFSSFGFSFLLSFLAWKCFPKLGLMDRPERYGHKRDPIPYPSGAALVAAVVLSMLIFLPLNAMVTSVLSGVVMLGITAFVDDRRGLSPYFRFVVQILAAVLIILGGVGIASISNPFGDPIVLDAFNLEWTVMSWTVTITVLADLLTIAWLVVMINAFNWIDGVPGMANAVAAVAALILLLLSIRPDFHFVDQSLAISLSAIVLGASLGALIFDFPPPKMLLGDTGSMLLGFLLAVTAMISGGKIATTILVLGFPILDFLWVIGRRILKGQSPFKGDLGHFHHRLQNAGLSNRRIVILFTLVSLLFGSLSLTLHTGGKVVAFVGVLVCMGLVVILLLSRK